jgi:hypothetical protein
MMREYRESTATSRASRRRSDLSVRQSVILIELCLEALEEGEGVGRRASETGDDPTLIETPDLTSSMFHHHVTYGHLAVARNDHLPSVPDHENGRSSHVSLPEPLESPPLSPAPISFFVPSAGAGPRVPSLLRG